MRLPSIGFLLAFAGTPLPVQQGDLVIRTTTSLVEVRVVAEDKEGKPVANLDRSDFTILDNGEPQPIRLFAAYRGASPAVDAGGGAAQDDSPTPAEYALIVLDWLNTSYPRRIAARDQLLKLIRDYEPRQRVGVYVLGATDSGLICDFTYDRELLYARIADMSLDGENRHGPIADGKLSGPGGVREDGTLPSNADAAFLEASRQLVDTTVEFEKIADHIVKVPGRKTLIWMSEGVPLVVGGSYFAPFVESALHRMNKADTAIYSVDVGGLRPDLRSVSNSLFELAHRTGGVAFVMDNDLTAGVRSALDDMQVSYTLGFHMPEGAKPGSHELKVKVTRPNIKLRYRESYDPAGTVH